MLPRDAYVEKFAQSDQWAKFLEPPPPLKEGQDPAFLLPWKNMTRQVRSLTPNKLWNSLASRINAYPFATSDQCSEKHYHDVFEYLRLNNGNIDHFVECGVFHGGLSVLLAGCALVFNFQLDLVDISQAALEITYQRIRLTFPEALPHIRLFLGELPNYVKADLANPRFRNAVVHHDGSHRLTIVVSDLASLYFARSRIQAIMVQDTHLRHTEPGNFVFVDAAIAAVFGLDPRYQPMGTTFENMFPPTMNADGSKDVYFLAGRPEGMIIPLAENRFLYPHPMHSIDDLIAFPSRNA